MTVVTDTSVVLNLCFLEAKERILIPALAPLLDHLEHAADFWISASLRASVLREAGETT
ncbi:MAG TPA: DUF3368 domain-containing protein [Methylomirabilota bacterium]|nr:DUF3368 domain-containing protein [Methylomirabilota bacterium]